MDYNKIIEKYYTPGTELYNIFMRHSRDVTRRALQISTHILSWAPTDSLLKRPPCSTT